MFLKTTAQSSAEKKSGQSRDTTSRASISVGGGGTADGGGTGGEQVARVGEQVARVGEQVARGVGERV